MLFVTILIIIIGGYFSLKYFLFKPAANQLLLHDINVTIPFVWDSDTSDNNNALRSNAFAD